jgi:transposase
MFLREHRVKRKGKSYAYLKLVENVRTDDGPRQRILANLGSRDLWTPDKIAELRRQLGRLEGAAATPPSHPLEGSRSWEFGEALALEAVWRRLRLSEHLEACLAACPVQFDVVGAIQVMVFNRLIDPESKLGLCQWQKRYFFPSMGVPAFRAHHYYRALDYLMQIKEGLESRLWRQMQDLFNSEATLVFYDMTDSAFYGAMERSQLAAFGHPKEGHAHGKQIMIGLVVNREGIPITHQVFRGNTKDNTTVAQVAADLKKRFHIRHCIFVGDCGTLNAKSVLGLEDSGGRYDYITSLKLRRNGEAEELLKQLPGREGFQKLSDEEWIHVLPRVPQTDGSALRYVATYHPRSARAAAHARQERLQKVLQEMEYLGRPADQRKRRDAPDKIRRAIAHLLATRRAEKFFQWTYSEDHRLHYEWDATALAQEQALDGLQILKTNSTTLADEEVVRGYRTLWRVERAFREVKDNIALEPNYHHTDLRIAAHVFCCVLAYLMENVIDTLLDQARSPFSARTALQSLRAVHIDHLPVIDRNLKYVHPPEAQNARILAALGQEKIPTIV